MSDIADCPELGRDSKVSFGFFTIRKSDAFLSEYISIIYRYLVVGVNH